MAYSQENKIEFAGYTPFGFNSFARGRQVLVQVGKMFVKVSKKELNKSIKGNRVTGFTFSDQPLYIWVTYIG